MSSLTVRNSSRFRSFGAGLFWAIIDLYALFMAGYLLLHTLTGTSWWPIGLLANFAHWLLLPLLAVLPLAFWRRRWFTVLLSAIGAFGFLVSYGALFLPPTAAVHASSNDALPLTVMTYNIQNYKIPPDELVAIINAADADIVSVIELGWRQAAALENTDYPYRVLHGWGSDGLGLLSRYPILEHETFLLDSRKRPHMRAVLDVDGVPLTVMLAHPPSPKLRNYQYWVHPAAISEIATLAERVASEQSAILLGDLNTSDQSDAYQAVIDAGLIDSFRTVGWGFGGTWPTPRLTDNISLPALVRIDYIFHTPELQSVAVWVEQSTEYSDHLPVIAELLLSRPAAAP